MTSSTVNVVVVVVGVFRRFFPNCASVAPVACRLLERARVGYFKWIDFVHQLELMRKAIRRSGVSREEFFVVSKIWNDEHRSVEEAVRLSLADLGLERAFSVRRLSSWRAFDDCDFAQNTLETAVTWTWCSCTGPYFARRPTAEAFDLGCLLGSARVCRRRVSRLSRVRFERGNATSYSRRAALGSSRA